MGNPYDEYDAFDPLEDDELETEGGYEYVEDESEEGNFEYVEDDLDLGAESPALPRTMVRRRAYVEPDGQSYAAPARGPKLLRKRPPKRGRSTPPAAYRPPDYRVQDVPPVEAPQPKPKRPRRRRRYGCLLTIVVTLVVCIVGTYWVFCHPIDEQLAFSSEEQAGVSSSVSWSVPGMPYYVLALGSDAQEGDTYSRSDSMMLIRVDLIGAKITMLSIPRDTRVEIDGYGTQKINAAYAFGGAGGAVKAVSKLTGAHISHVAVVHIDELAGLVDYLGGVEVDVPEAAYDPDHTFIDLDEGLQTLDGDTAVAWARTRYGYARGDFQRQEDQRILMQAIMNKVLSLSPREMPGALREVASLIGTDMRCYNLIPLFLCLKLSNPTVYSCSVPSTTETIEGVSYVIADEAALTTMMQTINAGGNPNATLDE